VGKQAVARANELLGGASLTPAAEPRSIRGGFILVDDRIETNCAFETLVRLERANMAGEVAKLLFD
jgi:V/A-type H+-transporting ATPase subunit E